MRLLAFLFALFALCLTARAVPPNVIVIFVDDLGWQDLGLHKADLSTPHIDSLATNGARFTSGYVACPVCSPSRAGLMTGRHQQRFGYEINPGPDMEHNPIFGLPLTECTIGNRMKDLGYATAWIGKSHLGSPQSGVAGYHPMARGLDRFFGFLEGHHSYCFPQPGIPLSQTSCDSTMDDPIQSGTAPNPPTQVTETEYLTTAFGREIVAFINGHAASPFFVYAPFNAVHEPMHVTPDLMSRTASLFPAYNPLLPENAALLLRHKLSAMLLAVDDEVRDVLAALRSHPDPNFPEQFPTRTLEHNTLIFFSSDNGAPPATRFDANGSVSTPLKDNKSSVYEGGIRVPYLLQWKGTLAARVVDAPVSTMDILPTSVAASGGTIPAAWQLDGVNLLPYLMGQTSAEPHPTLFWRVESGRASEEMEPGQRAMRQGQWKLVKPSWYKTWELYDLATDIGEANNLADDNPGKVQEMLALFDAWEATLATPRWDYNTPEYVKPYYVMEDVRLGSTASSYLGAEFLPGGAHAAFQDETASLWCGNVDRATGFFLSPNGRDLQVTSNLAPFSVNHDGPQWGLSSGGASLFYTKAGTASRLQIWRASNLGPSTAITELTTHAANDSFGARVSQEQANPTVKLAFNRSATGVLVADETTPETATLLPNQAGVESNGRWIPSTEDLVYVRTPTLGGATQLARYHTATNMAVTLTDDLGGKTDAWAFIAPEYGNELCYAAVVNRLEIAIYRYQGRADGIFDRVATLAVPAALTARFLYFVEPLQGQRGFNGTSQFTCAAYENNDPNAPGNSAIWLMGLGPDDLHRMPQLPPPADPCLVRLPITLRLDDPAAAGVAFDPETFVGQREVFCYYGRRVGANPTQLRKARTGLVLPDYSAGPSGFASLPFTRDYTPPAADVSGQIMGGTETTALVVHAGKLFAGISSRGDARAANDPARAGAQLLVKDSATSAWRVDQSPALTTLFRAHRGVEVLTELTFTKEGLVPLGSPAKVLVASLSDIGTPGATQVSARTRVGEGDWAHSTVANTVGPAYATSFATHLDLDADNMNGDDPGLNPGVERIFAGLSNGELYRGTYDQSDPGRLVWNPTAEISIAALKLGPIMSLAEANGVLYAACGKRQDNSGDPVTGGLYARNDHNDTWVQVYGWPTPMPAHAAAVEHRVMTGLTAVPDPRGCDHQVLLGARSWPGVIERIDPVRDHAVAVELDVRDFFARRWNDPSLRTENVLIGYTSFTPAKDPVTDQIVHLIGLWIEHPDSAAPPRNGSHFLVRYPDATYEAADIENFSPSVPAGQSLRASRCFAPSPFLEDGQTVLYVGGYDTAALPAQDTAWIMRGAWAAWPELDIAQPTAQSFQLTWPAVGEGWQLESSPTLGPAAAWQPVLGKPSISPLATTLSVSSNLTRLFYRLHRP